MSTETFPKPSGRSYEPVSIVILVVVVLGLICGISFIGYAMYQKYSGKAISILSSTKSDPGSAERAANDTEAVSASSSDILKNGPELTGALFGMFAPLAAVNGGHSLGSTSPFGGNDQPFEQNIPLSGEQGQDSFNPPVDAEIPAQVPAANDDSADLAEPPPANLRMGSDEPTEEQVEQPSSASVTEKMEETAGVVEKVSPITPEEAQSLEREYMRGRDYANRSSFSKAREVWLPLAERGYAKAQVALGRMYARGDGVRRDFAQSQRWFKAAARQKDDQGMLYLGKMYLNGDGVQKDREKALVLFESAAEKGNSDARDLVRSLSR